MKRVTVVFLLLCLNCYQAAWAQDDEIRDCAQIKETLFNTFANRFEALYQFYFTAQCLGSRNDGTPWVAATYASLSSSDTDAPAELIYLQRKQSAIALIEAASAQANQLVDASAVPAASTS